jgi:hypothetical protein
MKVLIGLVIVGVIVLGIVYYAGGMRNFDPNAQSKQARAAISPGMTWQQVIDAAGEPHKYQTILPKPRGGMTMLEPAARVPFDRNSLIKELATNAHPHGFVFPYTFSESTRFLVYFDSKGVVERVSDQIGMADLLDTRKD